MQTQLQETHIYEFLEQLELLTSDQYFGVLIDTLVMQFNKQFKQLSNS